MQGIRDQREAAGKNAADDLRDGQKAVGPDCDGDATIT